MNAGSWTTSVLIMLPYRVSVRHRLVCRPTNLPIFGRSVRHLNAGSSITATCRARRVPCTLIVLNVYSTDMLYLMKHLRNLLNHVHQYHVGSWFKVSRQYVNRLLRIFLYNDYRECKSLRSVLMLYYFADFRGLFYIVFWFIPYACLGPALISTNLSFGPQTHGEVIP